MHICFASLDYPDETGGGGVGTYAQTMGLKLVERGHRVSVVALKKGSGSADLTDDKGVKVFWIRSGNLHWYISKLPFIGRIFALPVRELEYSSAVLTAVREIDKRDPIDIVEGTETGVCGLRLRPGIRKVIRLHGERYTFEKNTPGGHVPVEVRLSRYLQRRAFFGADRLTSPSRTHASEISGEMKGRGPGIDVIPNPVGFSSLSRIAVNPTHPLFLYVGRLQSVKGVLDFLKAAPMIISRVPGARFILAGSLHPSVPKERIDFLLNEAGIRKRVDVLGHVDGGRLETLYAEAAVVVLPSYYETFGYACLEALMRGVPVVAFDSGPVKELIVSGRNGFLSPVGDVAALADACIAAVGLKVSVPERGEFARYAPEQVCNKMISLYENLLCND